jgi:hypothetical protein
MIMRYEHLTHHPNVFQAVTGLRIGEFDELLEDVQPQYAQTERERLERRERQRAIGAGHPFELSDRDQILLTVVWLRLYPTHEVLGYMFGVSDSTVSRLIRRVLPVLERAGRDTMRMPDPGKKRRRTLDDLLRDTPELVVVIDSFEQRVQRPRDRDEADGYYSGKKKQHTLKSQVAVDETTGQVVDVSASVPGPTADLKLLIWPMWASPSCTPVVWARRPVANRVVSRALPKTSPTTLPFRGGVSLPRTPLAACAAIKALPSPTAIIASFTRLVLWLLLDWSTVRLLIVCLPDVLSGKGNLAPLSYCEG